MPPREPREEPQTYEEYAGFYTSEMRQRAREAGCETQLEISDWLHEHYGRDQNRRLKPPPYRRPDESPPPRRRRR